MIGMNRLCVLVLVFTSIVLYKLPAPAQMDLSTMTSIGIDEHLGASVPLEAVFTDEEGDTVTLDELIDKPTLLSLVYYRCPGICKPLLSGVAEVLGKLDMVPGEDYQVITLSFDERDRPEDSRRMRRDYLTAVGKPFPEDSWHFLTGDTTEIRRVTNALGFRFRRSGEDFVHPAALIVLTPKGQIARYLYGLTYLPFDLKMALIEASKGRSTPTIAKVLLYCFSYDPEGKKYVVDVTRIAGAGVLLGAVLLVSVLAIRRKGPGKERG